MLKVRRYGTNSIGDQLLASAMVRPYREFSLRPQWYVRTGNYEFPPSKFLSDFSPKLLTLAGNETRVIFARGSLPPNRKRKREMANTTEVKPESLLAKLERIDTLVATAFGSREEARVIEVRKIIEAVRVQVKLTSDKFDKLANNGAMFGSDLFPNVKPFRKPTERTATGEAQVNPLTDF